MKKVFKDTFYHRLENQIEYISLDSPARAGKFKSDLTLIQSKIFEIRGQKVMLDFDLAEMYQVETKILNLSVKCNMKRFPSDFMFQLTKMNGVI